MDGKQPRFLERDFVPVNRKIGSEACQPEERIRRTNPKKPENKPCSPMSRARAEPDVQASTTSFGNIILRFFLPLK